MKEMVIVGPLGSRRGNVTWTDSGSILKVGLIQFDKLSLRSEIKEWSYY